MQLRVPVALSVWLAHLDISAPLHLVWMQPVLESRVDLMDLHTLMNWLQLSLRCYRHTTALVQVDFTAKWVPSNLWPVLLVPSTPILNLRCQTLAQHALKKRFSLVLEAVRVDRAVPALLHLATRRRVNV
jgi:hypothetical protein